MNRRQLLALATGTFLLGSAPLMAQQTRVSPPDVTGAVVDGNRVTVYYSRPFSKDPKTGAVRKIWGGLVPFGQVWRLGANEATMLVTQQPIELGGVTIPAGASTLFLLPQQNGPAKLIVNKQIGQWGSQYDDKQDLARIDLKTETLENAVDQFTMAVVRTPNTNGGVLSMKWENTQYSVPFTVKK
jgi:hypothetical protein